MVQVPFAAVTAPWLVLPTTMLAPPSGSPCAVVTRPVMTAPCWARSGRAVSKASTAATLPTSSDPDRGARIICPLGGNNENGDGKSPAGRGRRPARRETRRELYVNDPLGSTR